MAEIADLYVNEFEWISVSNKISNSNYRGILGLSPKDESSGPLFV